MVELRDTEFPGSHRSWDTAQEPQSRAMEHLRAPSQARQGCSSFQPLERGWWVGMWDKMLLSHPACIPTGFILWG